MQPRRAARGRKYRKGYYAGAIIMMVVVASSLYAYKDMFSDPYKVDTNIASMLVDLTTIYFFALVVVSTNRVRKLREKLASDCDHSQNI